MREKNKIELPLIVKEFLEYIVTVKCKSKNTEKCYQIDLIMFFKFMMIHKSKMSKKTNLNDIEIKNVDVEFIKEIDIKDIHEFLEYLKKEKNNSNSSRARKISTIKSFFNYLYITVNSIERNITEHLKVPQHEQKLPVYLELDEAKELLESIDGKFKERDYCMVTFFLNLGLRLSELINIKLKNIKNDDKLIVDGKGKKQRVVYLNEACKNALFKYKSFRNNSYNVDPEGYLFLSSRKGKLNPRTVQIMIKKYVKKSGVNENCTPHKLRHSAATLMHKYGNVDIRRLQKVLGHENINTTTIYTHVTDDEVRDAIRHNPLNINEKSL